MEIKDIPTSTALKDVVRIFEQAHQSFLPQVTKSPRLRRIHRIRLRFPKCFSLATVSQRRKFHKEKDFSAGAGEGSHSEPGQKLKRAQIPCQRVIAYSAISDQFEPLVSRMALVEAVVDGVEVTF